MIQFMLTVSQYRTKLEQTFGYADREMVKRYAVDRQAHRAVEQKFDPFTDDPNCKSCRKKKRA